ncbi:MAG: VOC family protein [Chloroflexota bacterium]
MRFIPYLTFNGNCREALTFYSELFEGESPQFTLWQAEMIENIPDATTEHIMHGDVNLNGYLIAGSDQFGENYSPTGNISLMIDISDLADATTKFAALSEGGQIMMPFGKTFWAAGYGFCTDRFGIGWQINCSGS